MKKSILLFTAMIAMTALQAQWVDDPVDNTYIANCSATAGEIFLSTDPTSCNTYIQWMQSSSNGWGPVLQCLNSEGIPQWGSDGISLLAHQFSSSSDGVAMAATSDGGVVSCFATYDDYTYAVKLNADGTYAWGEEGILLFDGQGFSRTQIIASNNGGAWALGSDYNNLYLQYIQADGTLSPSNTISDNTGRTCAYGQLTLGNDNNVFVTFERLHGNGFYKEKEILVTSYATDGTQNSRPTLLMTGLTCRVTDSHRAISDGMGGGYAYIWHSGINESFNTYVFHFNENGVSTIEDTYGVAVHSADPSNYYLNAYATVDPVSHDLLVAFEQTDAAYQRDCKLFVNRITSNGMVLWDDGILVIDNGTIPCGGTCIDAFEYGDGFAVTYFKGISQTGGSQASVEAQGFDMNGNELWSTQMCSNTYYKTGCRNSTGFHGGQNIIAWVNSTNAVYEDAPGGLYGQNIGWDGSMGEVTAPTPPDDPTSIAEETNEEIVDIIKVYNLNGQQMGNTNLKSLNRGVYLIQGLTRNGKLVTRKQAINF